MKTKYRNRSFPIGLGQRSRERAKRNTRQCLFVDTLAKHLTKKVVVGKKEQLKWNGGLNELMEFVTSVLKLEGKWKQSRVRGKQKPDQPPHLKHTFQDSKLNITVNWWSSSKTLLFQGGQKRIIEIEKTVFSLLGDTNFEVEEATEKKLILNRTVLWIPQGKFKIKEQMECNRRDKSPIEPTCTQLQCKST